QTNSAHLEFLWLELTNRCNLECVHCYADSSPSADSDVMTLTDFVEVLREAYSLGCRRVQFIGGEPTLNRDLPALLYEAHTLGYEFIEVYTNLIWLSDEILKL